MPLVLRTHIVTTCGTLHTHICGTHIAKYALSASVSNSILLHIYMYASLFHYVFPLKHSCCPLGITASEVQIVVVKHGVHVQAVTAPTYKWKHTSCREVIIYKLVFKFVHLMGSSTSVCVTNDCLH
jgi:hypothetical protein